APVVVEHLVADEFALRSHPDESIVSKLKVVGIVILVTTGTDGDGGARGLQLAETIAVTGDNAGHARAVAVTICQRCATAEREITMFQRPLERNVLVLHEVTVFPVDTGIDHGPNDAR